MGDFYIWNAVTQEAEPALLKGWNGVAAKNVDSQGVMPKGYLTMEEMVADDGFVVAHRGGSQVWPEMSMRAFTNAVAWGAKALEFSCARSADGVYFGMHDDNFDRTSQTTGTPNANTLTWNAIRTTYKNKVNAPTGGIDYTKLEDVLDAYASTHLFFIDPKGIGSTNYLELLNLLKTYAPATRFIIKYYWSNTSLADLAHAQGFKTWGYYYESNMASVASTQAKWDMLGMEVGASPANWTTMLSYGKPVIAHLAYDLSYATTALGKGADGLMTPGIPSVLQTPLVWE